MGRALQWPTKDPGSVRTYALDLSDDLTGAIISQVSAVSAPSGDGEMSIDAVTVSGDLVELSLDGGVPGRSYLVKISVTPFGVLPIDYTCWIYIDRVLASWPSVNPINFGFGVPVTWIYLPSLDLSNQQNTWMAMIF